MTTATRTRYRQPVVHPEPVYLSDFGTQEIVDYLVDKGYVIGGGKDADAALECLVITEDELTRMDTLLLCGQRESAVEMLFELVQPKLARRLKP